MSKNKSVSLLDQLVSDLIITEESIDILNLELSNKNKSLKAIPLRYRIIAEGLANSSSLETVNSRLVSNGCEQLYARSPYEAALIFAFNNGYNYEQWKKIINESAFSRKQVGVTPYLNKDRISLQDVRSYVNENSTSDDEDLYITIHRTKQLGRHLSQTQGDVRDFLKFMSRNSAEFSFVRESTRYYFCKYLMFFLETRKNDYLSAIQQDKGIEKATRRLSVIKAQTVLTRNTYNAMEASKIIDTAPISFSEIYDAFQSFYFGYTSVDWLNVLLDRYDLEHLSPKQIRDLAAYIKSYTHSSSILSDDEVVSNYIQEQKQKELDADRKHSLELKRKTYGADRVGENFLRKILRGYLDLDRTTFLAFLLFFDKESVVPIDQRINQKRLAEILVNCGFPGINTNENAVDDFFIDYLNAEDPMVFLLSEAEIMAMSEENFYLYKTYLQSKSNVKEFEKLL